MVCAGLSGSAQSLEILLLGFQCVSQQQEKRPFKSSKLLGLNTGLNTAALLMGSALEIVVFKMFKFCPSKRKRQTRNVNMCAQTVMHLHPYTCTLYEPIHARTHTTYTKRNDSFQSFKQKNHLPLCGV